MRLFHISRIAMNELLYERVFYILLAFAVIGVVFGTALGQLSYGDQAKLSLDFMLAGIQIVMVLFSIFVGVGLFQKEMTSGSIAMVLSKPIARSTFLLGKFIGQLVVQLTVIVALVGLTLLTRHIQEDLSFEFALAIGEAAFLIYLETIILASLAYFLATFCGGMTTAAVTLSFFFLGHFRKTIDLSTSSGWLWTVFEKVLPNLELFNFKTLASYGFNLPAHELLAIFCYALVCSATFLIPAVLVFNERDILT